MASPEMWQVTYNPSVVWCLALPVTFPLVGSKGDGTQIQTPMLADMCMKSSSGIAE